MSKELEEAISRITICKSSPIMYGSCIISENDLDIVLKALDNSIDKSIIEDKIEEIKEMKTNE